MILRQRESRSVPAITLEPPSDPNWVARGFLFARRLNGTADERGWTQMVYSWRQEQAHEKSEGEESECRGGGGDAHGEAAAEDGGGDQPVDEGELCAGDGGGAGELREADGEARRWWCLRGGD